MSKINRPSPETYSIQVTAPTAGIKKNSSFWYGGPVSHIVYKDYHFCLEAMGDIRVGYTAKEGDEPEWFKDKNNGGQMQEYFGDVFADDDELYQAIKNFGTKKYPQLEFQNNNWWECIIKDPNGQFHDIMWALDTDNYFEAIDEIVENMDRVIEEIETMNN